MAHSDEALNAISEQFGAEGYGIYWYLVEDIAAAIEPGKDDPTAEHSEVKWANICNCSTRRLRTVLAKMTELRLICVESAPELRQNCGKRPSIRLRIAIPNILKYKDEYSRKSGYVSGHSQDLSRVEQIQNKERMSEQPKKPVVHAQQTLLPESKNGTSHQDPKPVDRTRWFNEEFWPIVWAKIGKDACLKAWLKRVTDRAKADYYIEKAKAQGPEIMAAAESRAKNGERPSPLHPSTWLANGRDADEPTLFTAKNTSAEKSPGVKYDDPTKYKHM